MATFAGRRVDPEDFVLLAKRPLRKDGSSREFLDNPTYGIVSKVEDGKLYWDPQTARVLLPYHPLESNGTISRPKANATGPVRESMVGFVCFDREEITNLLQGSERYKGYTNNPLYLNQILASTLRSGGEVA